MRPILILLLLSTCQFCFSQSFLYLKKLNGRMAIRYELNDEIRFQLKGEQQFVTGTIESFGEAHFVVHETVVPLGSIARYDIRDKPYFSFNYEASSHTLIAAGVLLPLAEVVNQQVQDFGQSPSLHRSVLIGSLSLMAGGLLLKWLAPKYFKPGFKRKAVIID